MVFKFHFCLLCFHVPTLVLLRVYYLRRLVRCVCLALRVVLLDIFVLHVVWLRSLPFPLCHFDVLGSFVVPVTLDV